MPEDVRFYNLESRSLYGPIPVHVVAAPLERNERKIVTPKSVLVVPCDRNFRILSEGSMNTLSSAVGKSVGLNGGFTDVQSTISNRINYLTQGTNQFPFRETFHMPSSADGVDRHAVFFVATPNQETDITSDHVADCVQGILHTITMLHESHPLERGDPQYGGMSYKCPIESTVSSVVMPRLFPIESIDQRAYAQGMIDGIDLYATHVGAFNPDFQRFLAPIQEITVLTK